MFFPDWKILDNLYFLATVTYRIHQHIIKYCPTYLLLKPHINAGKVLKLSWELISYHLYSNESGRNYCFSYNASKKMEVLHASSFFKVSTDNKWLEPSGLNPGSSTPEPVRGHLGQLSAPPARLFLPSQLLLLGPPSLLIFLLGCVLPGATREGSVIRPKPTLPLIQKLPSQSSETHNCKII